MAAFGSRTQILPSAKNLFTESDNTVESYILKGRIVTMTGQGVIDSGNIMIEGSQIVAVWADGDIPPINTDNITIYDTEATIYPGLIDLHNHMHYNHIPLWDFEVHLSDSQKSEEGGTQIATSGAIIGIMAQASLG